MQGDISVGTLAQENNKYSICAVKLTPNGHAIKFTMFGVDSRSILLAPYFPYCALCSAHLRQNERVEGEVQDGIAALSEVQAEG
jgi:hypothetical protein